MKISRVMSRDEFDSFMERDTMIPDSNYYVGRDNQAGEHTSTKDGCFFFVPGDARNFNFWQLEELYEMADSKFSDWYSNVLAVFDFHGSAVPGQAKCSDEEGTIWRVPELYVPSYSDCDTDLVWCDLQWNETGQYIEDLMMMYGRDDDDLGLVFTKRDYSRVPARFRYPYKAPRNAESWDSKNHKYLC